MLILFRGKCEVNSDYGSITVVFDDVLHDASNFMGIILIVYA